ALMNRGEYAVALPTLAREREAAALSFDAQPYYFEALALLGAGDPDTAMDRLQEAEGRLSEARDPSFKPLIDAGFAQVFLALAEQAFEENATSRAFDMLDGVEIRARSAIQADPLLVPAHLALAQRYEMENQYRDALEVLNEALAHPQLKSNVNLIVERG